MPFLSESVEVVESLWPGKLTRFAMNRLFNAMFVIGLAYFNFQFLFYRLATFIAGYELFQIEVNKTYGISSWRSDLKKVWFSSTQK